MSSEAMEARERKTKADPPTGRRIPVVYYLCRNMNLEQPHFLEVPCSSEGLYLKDVMNRLNSLRGKGMAAMYSWACKRSYKNGFVWQDLSEEDLIFPAHGSEYVLKGSERVNDSPSYQKRGKPETLASKPPQRGSSRGSSPDVCYKEVNSPWRAVDASTQTDEIAGEVRRDGDSLRTRGVSTDESSFDLKIKTAVSKERSEINADEISPPPTSSSASSSGRKTESLETLIRADAKKTSFRLGENVPLPSAAKLKATDLLMQLITCGSIAVKDSYGARAISYRPRISRVRPPSPDFSSARIMRDLDNLLMENPRRIEEKTFFSGSLIETRNREMEAKFVPSLKRSSSYNEERSCNSPVRGKGKKKQGESGKKPKSPIQDGRRISKERRDSASSRKSSKRFSEPSPSVKSPSRSESFREKEKGKIVKIEERLTSGARVVIHSTRPCRESDDSSSS